jgi:hypothetical protein
MARHAQWRELTPNGGVHPSAVSARCSATVTGRPVSRLASHPVVCPAGAARCRTLGLRADCFKPGRQVPGARDAKTIDGALRPARGTGFYSLLPRSRSAVRSV